MLDVSIKNDSKSSWERPSIASTSSSLVQSGSSTRRQRPVRIDAPKTQRAPADCERGVTAQLEHGLQAAIGAHCRGELRQGELAARSRRIDTVRDTVKQVAYEAVARLQPRAVGQANSSWPPPATGERACTLPPPPPAAAAAAAPARSARPRRPPSSPARQAQRLFVDPTLPQSRKEQTPCGLSVRAGGRYRGTGSSGPTAGGGCDRKHPVREGQHKKHTRNGRLRGLTGRPARPGSARACAPACSPCRKTSAA